MRRHVHTADNFSKCYLVHEVLPALTYAVDVFSVDSWGWAGICSCWETPMACIGKFSCSRRRHSARFGGSLQMHILDRLHASAASQACSHVKQKCDKVCNSVIGIIEHLFLRPNFQAWSMEFCKDETHLHRPCYISCIRPKGYAQPLSAHSCVPFLSAAHSCTLLNFTFLATLLMHALVLCP